MINVAGKAMLREVWLNGHYLEIAPSQRLSLKEVSFDWGKPGAGADQLALAILLELTGEKNFALNNYAAFSASWVVALPHDKDFLGWSKIDEWVTARGGKIKNGYKIQVPA